MAAWWLVVIGGDDVDDVDVDDDVLDDDVFDDDVDDDGVDVWDEW